MNADYRRTPVLFVHGHGLTSETWSHMRVDLAQRGYPGEYLEAVDIVPNTMANARAAETVIAPGVERLLARAQTAARRAGAPADDPTRVDLVAHSMGAVGARWYAAKLRPDRVRTWIAIAGANHGTEALCPYRDDAAREMCPAFASRGIQAALNGTADSPLDETPFGLGTDRPGTLRIPPDGTRTISYITVRIDPDPWITPARSALLDGAGGLDLALPRDLPVIETSPGNYLFRRQVSHDPLPEHAELIRFVALVLTAEH
jgi:pimeloyl-ACP methyl ester carboxylesterase